MADYDLSAAAFESYEGDSYEGDSYDPSMPMSYDPSVANNFGPRRSGVFPKARAGAPAQAFRQSPVQRQGPRAVVPEAQVNLTITNNADTDIQFELFNWQNSYTKFANSSLYPNCTPLDAVHVLAYNLNGSDLNSARVYGAQTVQTIGGVSTLLTGSVGFLPNGDLQQQTKEGNAGAVTVHCQETPYRTLFEWTASGIIKIKKMRIDSQNADQLKQNMQWFKQTILGARTSQNIPFVSAKDPYQFQTTIIDVNNSYTITKEMGLSWLAKADSTTNITLFIELWSAGV